MATKKGSGNTETGMTVISYSANTQEVIEMLELELKKLKTIEESVFKTDGKVEGFSNTIQTETNVGKLISMWASIKARENAYQAALKDLDVMTAPVFLVNGYSVDSYKSDIQLKIEIVTQKERTDQLKEFKKEMESFLTEADKKKALFAKMDKFFGSMSSVSE